METEKPEDLDNKWFDRTIKFAEKLSENGDDWNALPEREQELAALWKLQTDMYNGGFIQFFCNWGYDCYLHAVRSLTRLKAERALSIIQQQYQIIRRLEDDKRLKELWDIPKYLTEAEFTKINDELDRQYRDDPDNIVEKTFQVYSELLAT